MARFWKWEINPDVKAYLRYFSRGLLVTLAVLAVLVLIGVSFFYGDRRRQDESGDTASTQNFEESGQPVGSPDDQPGASGDTAGNNQGDTASGAPTPTPTPTPAPTPTPVTGPTSGQMPNTGPRENAAIAATALVLLAVKYRKGRQALNTRLAQ